MSGQDCPLEPVAGVGSPVETQKFKVPMPFKMGVGNKLTFYYKQGDFKAGLAGVSVEVQGVKAAQVGPSSGASMGAGASQPMTATGRFCLGLPGTQEALSLRCKEPGSHQPPPPCIHAHSSMLIHAHETCFPLPAGDHCAAARRLNRKLRADAACPRRCLRPVDPHQQVSCRKPDWLGTSTAHNHTRVDASRVPFPVLCPSSPPCDAPSLPAERTRQCWECSASSRCLACASRTQRARCGRCRPALRVRCPGKDPRLTSGSAALGLPLACSTSEGWPGWQAASPKMMQQGQQAQQVKHA